MVEIRHNTKNIGNRTLYKEQWEQKTLQRPLETEDFTQKTLHITLDTKTVSRDILVVIVNEWRCGGFISCFQCFIEFWK